MPRIVTLSGSPFPSTRTQLLAEWIGGRLAAQGFGVESLSVRDLPAEDLLWCRPDTPALKSALELVERARGVVVVTPVHKAAYSGALKAFLDVLPQHGLENKVVLPVAVGASLAHALAIDYGLRPVLASMGAPHVVAGVFVLDKLLERTGSGGLRLESEIEDRLNTVMEEFAVSIRRHHRDQPRQLAGTPLTTA
jgi:FMN reductase